MFVPSGVTNSFVLVSLGFFLLNAKSGMDQVIIDVGVPFIGQKVFGWEYMLTR